MSSANWQKQWFNDSHVVIPKTTKWRQIPCQFTWDAGRVSGGTDMFINFTLFADIPGMFAVKARFKSDSTRWNGEKTCHPGPKLECQLGGGVCSYIHVLPDEILFKSNSN